MGVKGPPPPKDAIMGEAADDPAYMHVIMSQLGLPYREVQGRDYIRRTGRASMVVSAGFLTDPHTGKPVLQGVPYGAKARLLTLYFCTEAVRRQSPVVEMSDSMTALMRLFSIAATGGKKGSIAPFKEQLHRLVACRMQFFMDYGNRKRTMNPAPMIRDFEVWFPADPHQRIMWPTTLRLSDEFYTSLLGNALPLDPKAFGALQHSARALDLYTWLAHRLWRVKESAGVPISWGALQKQFGAEVSDLRDFRREYRAALRQVLAVYPAAKVELGASGLRLFKSEPAIARKTSVPVTLVGQAPGWG
ncbi:MAG: hypothetical protein EON48_02130 [Acetobacteraceae bacterium]|nr:MAG: hypothetical protein EON48_02130 [Acetobacteraceae bacterium]